MSRKNPTTELKEKILQLENKRAAELSLLKAQFNQSVESLNPSFALGEVFSQNNHSPVLLDKLFSGLLGIISGYLVKKLIIGSSKNMLKQGIGLIVQLAITNVIAKNSHWLKATASYMEMNFFKNGKIDKKAVMYS